jgi:hypothetical protein
MDRDAVSGRGHCGIAVYRAVVGILVLYIIAAEMAKKLFYRKQKL